MRKAFIYSIVFHLGVAVLALVGIPLGEPLPVEAVQTMDVDIAELTVTTKSQKPPREVEPEPKEEEPPKPPPAPKPQPAPPPEPEPEPEPAPEEPEEAEAPPVVEPEPEPEPKEPEVVEPEPQPEPAPPEEPKEKQVAIVTPTAKPRPKNIKKKDDFDSMLNTLELDNDKPVDAPDKPTKEKDFFDELNLDEIETADKPKPREETQIATVIGTRLTVSEKDALRRQIEKCWNVPIGARNPEELVVEIRIRVNRDRTVRDALIVDTSRMAGDTFYRSMAESARRAVKNHKCSPLELPPGKYNEWKDITMTFNPSTMVGQ